MKKFFKILGKSSVVMAAALLLAVGIVGCTQPAKGNGNDSGAVPPVTPTKYTVTVPATIEHGSLTVSPALPADNQVAKDTVLTFTATPTDATYEVDKWTITGGTVTEGGTPGSTTAKVKVTGNISVSVTFKAKVITPTKYTVTFSVDGGNGSLSASVDGTDISSGDVIEKGKTVLFTAKPAAGYKVAGWTLDGAPVTDTNPSYSVTVEKTVDVKVRFSELTETDKFIDTAVKIPGATIVGAEHDAATNGDLPDTRNQLKGVFIKNRTVMLSEYVMTKTEVPYWLWKEVYDWATEDKNGDGTPDHGYKFANKGKKGSKDDKNSSEKEPVTYVSWRDCIVWCNAFTEMVKGNTAECVYLTSAGGTVLKNAWAKTDGNFDCDTAYFDRSKKGFRLPTEAEWEYAARRKTDGTLLPLNYLSGATANYKDEEACKKVAWYDKNSNKKTHEVGTKAANALGLYDMSGNVWEWCWDWYDDNAAAGDGGVASVSDPFGAAAGESRVDRGGSWLYFASYCITGNRDKDRPSSPSESRGFRLAWYK